MKTIVLFFVRCLLLCSVVIFGVNSEAQSNVSVNKTPKIDQMIDSLRGNAAAMTTNEHKRQELLCLAENIYHESRNQSITGQLGVGLVTMNRVKSGRFPDTVCKVVRQGKHKVTVLADNNKVYIPILNQCQFSWYCDGKSDKIYDFDAFRDILKLSLFLMLYLEEGGDTLIDDLTKGALYYHTDAVSPHWVGNKRYILTIDKHIFYGRRH